MSCLIYNFRVGLIFFIMNSEKEIMCEFWTIDLFTWKMEAP
jgi:hypothetical protein